MTTIKTAPDVDHWHVPARNQGQIVTRAYGTDEDGTAYCRVSDASDRSVRYEALGQAAETWDPANGALDVES